MKIVSEFVQSRMAVLMGVLAFTIFFSGCGTAEKSGNEDEHREKEATVIVFAAKSLNPVMEELTASYGKAHPGVEILCNYDGSGTLMLQIEQGAECDIFFSAAQKQMDELEDAGYVVEGARHDVVHNHVCVVTYPGSGTEVTGLYNLDAADSIALADGSVPVGGYTREALVRADVLSSEGDASDLTTQEISAQLGGVTINECANVGAVAAAVAEGANEVGTVYYSDTYGYGDRLEILEMVSGDLTGAVVYPAAQIKNDKTAGDKAATDRWEADKTAAADFLEYLLSDEAKEVFEKYYFDTDVK